MIFAKTRRSRALDRRMRVRGAVGTLALLVMTAVPSTGVRAGRPVECTYDAATRTIEIARVGRAFHINLHLDGTEIHYNIHEQCGPDAALTTVDRIHISDQATGELDVSIAIDEPFEPGAEDEPGLSDEIEFVFDLGDGDDTVELVNGTGAAGHVTAGLREIDGRKRPVVNMNSDELDGVDFDAILRGVDGIQMWGSDESDVFDATGGSDTGEMLDRPTFLVGFRGSDTLLGGSVNDLIEGDYVFACDTPGCLTASDFIEGGPGADKISGGFGPDEVKGGEGRDHVVGGYADDVVKGGPGRDDVNGNPGDDTLYGNRDPDDLDGGDGADQCFGGLGQDSEKNCETSERLF